MLSAHLWHSFSRSVLQEDFDPAILTLCATGMPPLRLLWLLVVPPPLSTVAHDDLMMAMTCTTEAQQAGHMNVYIIALQRLVYLKPVDRVIGKGVSRAYVLSLFLFLRGSPCSL
jgi:hypothetical protein